MAKQLSPAGHRSGHGGIHHAARSSKTEMSPDLATSDELFEARTSFICGYADCGATFSQKHNMQAHQTLKHGRQRQPKGRGQHQDTSDPSTGDNMGEMFQAKTTYICGYAECGATFTQKHNLLAHQTVKHGRQPKSRGPRKRSLDHDVIGSGSGPCCGSMEN